MAAKRVEAKKVAKNIPPKKAPAAKKAQPAKAQKAPAKAKEAPAKAKKTLVKKGAAKAGAAATKAKAAPPKTKPPAKAKAPIRRVERATAGKASPSTKKDEPASSASPGVGDAAPSFSLTDQNGATVSSDSLRGQAYVLYFYPKDDTPGCTKEACSFRDDMGKFEAAGYRLIGVSPDKPESHARFAKKYGLNFTLLADPAKELVNAYGVWVQKKLYGREYMGVERATFQVGSDGKIQNVWRSVKVDGHSADVLSALG